MPQATQVLLPGSADEAIELFGNGDDVTVIAGGTIVVPELADGRRTPGKALLLTRAGLTGVSRSGSRVTIGAATPVQELVGFAAPVGPCAANVADIEIRAQGTVGGNLCATVGEVPRGDLQSALLAVGATVRSAGAGGVTEAPLEDFLGSRDGRLILDVSYDEPAAGSFVALERPHAHVYTALAVSAARADDGTVRIAATGMGSHGVRLTSAEKHADDLQKAGDESVADVTPIDDALASAWYREQMLPVLVRRALTDLQETA